ncbi:MULTISPECIES: hypothetical protein [Aerosakkonema]
MKNDIFFTVRGFNLEFPDGLNPSVLFAMQTEAPDEPENTQTVMCFVRQR